MAKPMKPAPRKRARAADDRHAAAAASAARVIEEVDDDDDDDDEPRPAPVVVSGDEVERLLKQLGAQASTARIIVTRISANQDPEECIDCPLSTFSKEQLRTQYGAGVYSCEVRDKGVIRRRWQWRFAAALTPAAATAPTDRARELELELRQARQQADARQHEILLAVLGRPQSERQAPTMGDLLETLASAKELIGGGGGGGISQLKELLEVRDLLGDGGGKGATGVDLALEAVKAIPDLIAAGQGGTPRARSSAKQIAKTSEDKMSASRPGGSEAQRSQAIKLLVHHAEQGTDPAVVAQFAYAKMCELEQQQFDAVCEFVDNEGAPALALLMVPSLRPHAEWVGKVVEQLRAAILQGDEQADLPGGGDSGKGAEVST